MKAAGGLDDSVFVAGTLLRGQGFKTMLHPESTFPDQIVRVRSVPFPLTQRR